MSKTFLEVLADLDRIDWPELLRFLGRHRTESEIAKRLQVKASTVCRWKSGKMKPRYQQRVALLGLREEIASAQGGTEYCRAQSEP